MLSALPFGGVFLQLTRTSWHYLDTSCRLHAPLGTIRLTPLWVCEQAAGCVGGESLYFNFVFSTTCFLHFASSGQSRSLLVGHGGDGKRITGGYRRHGICSLNIRCLLQAYKNIWLMSWQMSEDSLP